MLGGGLGGSILGGGGGGGKFPKSISLFALLALEFSCSVEETPGLDCIESFRAGGVEEICSLAPSLFEGIPGDNREVDGEELGIGVLLGTNPGYGTLGRVRVGGFLLLKLLFLLLVGVIAGELLRLLVTSQLGIVGVFFGLGGMYRGTVGVFAEGLRLFKLGKFFFIEGDPELFPD